jgi:hypothetical protein
MRWSVHGPFQPLSLSETPYIAGGDGQGSASGGTGPAYNATVPQAGAGKCEVAHSGAEKSPGGPSVADGPGRRDAFRSEYETWQREVGKLTRAPGGVA